MRSRMLLLTVLLVAGTFALPLVAQAGVPFFGPIIPNEQITVNGVITNQNVCAAGFGMLMIVINNIISFLITLAIVFVAPLMIAWSGFLFVVNPVNASGISQAKSILTHTVVGIIIALVGYLIVSALMAVLYNANAPANNGSGGVLGTWTALVTSNGASLCLPLAGSLKPAVTPPHGVVVTPTITGNEAAVRATLAASGISINKSPCPANTRYQDVSGGCTTVGGLNQNTVAQVINLKNICGSVQVTGGNELGHTDGGQSHTTGYKVDLATNVDGCIQGGSSGYFSASGMRGSYARYLDKCSNEYVRESTHWDITVTRDCLR